MKNLEICGIITGKLNICTRSLKRRAVVVYLLFSVTGGGKGLYSTIFVYRHRVLKMGNSDLHRTLHVRQ